MELRARKDVPAEQTWDLSLIYAEERLMWEDLEKVKAEVKQFADTYAGRLTAAETIVRCLNDMEKIQCTISRIWSYSGLALEADYTDNVLREREEKVSDEMTRLYRDMSFVDSEIVLGALLNQGFEWTDAPEEADVIVVNTCSFIRDSQKESVDTLLEMAELKKTGRCTSLIAMGCLPQRFADELMEAMPEVDHFVGTGRLSEIPALIAQDALPRKFVCDPGFIHTSGMRRELSTPPFSAFLKISEGCDNRCAFCVIPSIRGPQRSRTIEDITSEAKDLAKRGCVELSLIAQDLTAYGHDLPEKPDLEKLLRALVKVEGIRWIRLHYAYPKAITDGLMDVIAGEEKIVPYLDIPLQHISAHLLKSMRRASSPEFIRELMHRLREKIPGIALRTSLISGLPGETDEDHELLKEFVKEVRFERLGVFEFSPEEGTEAAGMPDQVPAKIAKRRRREIMALQARINREQNKALKGQVLDVLVEGASPESDDLLCGRHACQAVEVDGLTYINDGTARPGQIVKVQITRAISDYDLLGKIVG